MNVFSEALNNPVANALGWSLLHSVWQGLAIFMIVWLLLKFLAGASSQLRYGIACAGLLTMVAAWVVTFMVLISEHESITSTAKEHSATFSTMTNDLSATQQTGWDIAFASLETYMPFFLYAWFFGACLFSLRLVGGWWYINKLVGQATPIGNGWDIRLLSLADQMGLKAAIRLAESAIIKTPMVIGYLKPVILVPAGMLSGLSSQQIETIFLHELAHIKRHDFMVNIIQSAIEVIFFFNPVAWVLSGLIRKEREFCCDDTVLHHHGSRIDYVYALTRIEEARISESSLGLALGDDSNQLMKRIKRIMDKSFKTPREKERLLPVALVILGLLCASWLTIKGDHDPVQSRNVVQADTLKKRNQDRRHQRTNNDAKEKIEEVEEVVIDNYHWVDAWPGVIEIPDIPEIVEIPAIMDIEEIAEIPYAMELPEIADLPRLYEEIRIPAMAPIPPIEMDAFHFQLDSVPHPKRLRAKEWEEFNEQFEKKFKERFKDFYEKNQKDFDKMMKELQQNFQTGFDEDEWELIRESGLAEREKELMNLRYKIENANSPLRQELMAKEELLQAHHQALEAQKVALKMQRMKELDQLKMQEFAEHISGWETENSERMARVEREMKALEEQMKKFEKLLKEELVKDGYISKNEEIKDLEINDDGSFKVNGKSIKESHRKKYRELHDQYLGDRERFHHPE